MKKLVSSAACLLICFSIHAQTQTGKVSITRQAGDETQVESNEAKPVPVQQSTEQKAGETKADPANPHAACPKAATCPKAQAAQAESNQGEAKKPCCAKHQAANPDADAKTEQKAGCNHQNADQKATPPKKKGDGKK